MNIQRWGGLILRDSATGLIAGDPACCCGGEEPVDVCGCALPTTLYLYDADTDDLLTVLNYTDDVPCSIPGCGPPCAGWYYTFDGQSWCFVCFDADPPTWELNDTEGGTETEAVGVCEGTIFTSETALVHWDGGNYYVKVTTAPI